jgi:hypothetical protein
MLCHLHIVGAESYSLNQCINIVLCCRALGPVEAEAIPGLKDIHKFVDPYEVEIIARCCR